MGHSMILLHLGASSPAQACCWFWRYYCCFPTLFCFNLPLLWICILSNNECFLSSHWLLTCSHSQKKREKCFMKLTLFYNILWSLHSWNVCTMVFMSFTIKSYTGKTVIINLVGCHWHIKWRFLMLCSVCFCLHKLKMMHTDQIHTKSIAPYLAKAVDYQWQEKCICVYEYAYVVS